MRIVIDGNIGSGKTTQLDLLEKIGYSVKREPIAQWPLDLYYSDPERWGFLFQIIILQTLVPNEETTIYERSPISSRDVFWKTMKKTDIEDEAYRKQFDIQAWLPEFYIFIDKGPDNCFNQIKKRNQEGDSKISLDYLKELDSNYNLMFKDLECKKIKVDGNDTIEHIHNKIVNILKDEIKV